MARDQNQNMVSPPNSPMGANKHNFSYPSRTGPTPTTTNKHGEQDSPIGSGPHAGAMELPAAGEMTPGLDRQAQLGSPAITASGQRVSTLSNLKAAAAGMHGVGETLRGTLNSNIDRRFPGSGDKEKHAAIVQRHDDVVAAGRSEIENQRFHDSVREREKAGAVGKTISRKPLAQQDGGLRVTNQ